MAARRRRLRRLQKWGGSAQRSSSGENGLESEQLDNHGRRSATPKSPWMSHTQLVDGRASGPRQNWGIAGSTFGTSALVWRSALFMLGKKTEKGKENDVCCTTITSCSTYKIAGSTTRSAYFQEVRQPQPWARQTGPLNGHHYRRGVEWSRPAVVPKKRAYVYVNPGRRTNNVASSIPGNRPLRAFDAAANLAGRS